MKTTLFTAVVLASTAAIVQADNCTPKLNYCGHSLIAKGNYRGQLDQLYEDVLGLKVGTDAWTNDLFTCVGGRSGVVTRLFTCPNGVCNDNGNGKSDTCAGFDGDVAQQGGSFICASLYKLLSVFWNFRG